MIHDAVEFEIATARDVGAAQREGRRARRGMASVKRIAADECFPGETFAALVGSTNVPEGTPDATLILASEPHPLPNTGLGLLRSLKHAD